MRLWLVVGDPQPDHVPVINGKPLDFGIIATRYEPVLDAERAGGKLKAGVDEYWPARVQERGSVAREHALEISCGELQVLESRVAGVREAACFAVMREKLGAAPPANAAPVR